MSTPDGLEPLGIWDTRGVENAWHECMRDASEWACEHIPDASRTYRAEFYLLDAPFAVLHRYAASGTGHKHRDPATGEIAREEPVIVPLDELPPAHLLAP